MEVKPLLPLPEFLPYSVWREISTLINNGVFWVLLQPTALCRFPRWWTTWLPSCRWTEGRPAHDVIASQPQPVRSL